MISIHALRMEGDAIHPCRNPHPKRFLSTPSAWRATLTTDLELERQPSNFYPRPPHGGRHFVRAAVTRSFGFLSTPSAWRATSSRCRRQSCWVYFYPRPPHGGRLGIRNTSAGRNEFLSTPSAWRATHGNFVNIDPGLFLSTPSAWRATFGLLNRTVNQAHFYPRPPHGGRPPVLDASFGISLFLSTPSAWRATGRASQGCALSIISIHALRMEGDHLRQRPQNRRKAISIHALRMEGDLTVNIFPSGRPYFYPRPPHGGRRTPTFPWKTFMLFLSTPSAWRATRKLNSSGPPAKGFLSTPSAWRATVGWPLGRPFFLDFYPRPPHGGRLPAFFLANQGGAISIHALRMEGDVTFRLTLFLVVTISIHALRMEGDIFPVHASTSFTDFYPRPPHGGRHACFTLALQTSDFYPRPPHGGRLSL